MDRAVDRAVDHMVDRAVDHGVGHTVDHTAVNFNNLTCNLYSHGGVLQEEADEGLDLCLDHPQNSKVKWFCFFTQ